MTLDETLRSIRADAAGYRRWQTHPGFWVTFSYRIRRLRKYGPAWCQLLLPLDIAAGLVRGLLSDSKIPASLAVGQGLSLPHPNGIILNDLASIGSDVKIFQQVTVGEWRGKAPVIEDGCELFGGAKVFGGITLGRGTKVGANAVVSSDIPPYSSVAAPAPGVKAGVFAPVDAQ